MTLEHQRVIPRLPLAPRGRRRGEEVGERWGVCPVRCHVDRLPPRADGRLTSQSHVAAASPLLQPYTQMVLTYAPMHVLRGSGAGSDDGDWLGMPVGAGLGSAGSGGSAPSRWEVESAPGILASHFLVDELMPQATNSRVEGTVGDEALLMPVDGFKFADGDG
jgi:hypothetical protein